VPEILPAHAPSPRTLLAWDGTAYRPIHIDALGNVQVDVVGGRIGMYNAYVHVQDQKAVGVDGGGFTFGAWRLRDINTEQADTLGICAIAANQITLAAGTYRCLITCPAHRVDRHQTRLRNVTAVATLLRGTSEWSAALGDVASRSIISGRFTLAAVSILEIQHQCSATRAGTGFGVAAGFGVEIYTDAEFWREW